MDAVDIVMWATVNFAVSGYHISEIQKEKKTDKKDEKVPE